MPLLLKCPSCERELRVPDELLDKKVRCPGCATTFTAEAVPPTEPPGPPPLPTPPPLPETLNLPAPNLSLDDEPSPPPGPPPLGTPQSVSPAPPAPAPAPADDLEPCPFCGERIRKLLLRCPYCEEELPRPREPEPGPDENNDEDDARPWEGRPSRRPVRRDCEPHRGSLILAIGIISIPLALVAGCCGCGSYGIAGVAGIVGLALGIPAWVMGQRDLAKMRAGTMDPEGQGSTQGGMICGIVGTALNALGVLVSLAGLIFMLVIIFNSRPGGPFAPPVPPPPPQPRPPIKGIKKDAANVPRLAAYLPHRLAPKG